MRLNKIHLILAIFFGAGLIGENPIANAQSRATQPGAEAEKFAAVGILRVAGGGWCSAALIDQKTVLTAAHCVYPADTKELADPDRITFNAGWRDGITAAKRDAVRITAHRDYDPTAPYNDANIAADLAIVELADPIPADAARAYGQLDKIRMGEPISVVSFSGRRSDVASINGDCTVNKREKEILLLSCESHPGMSGAPIFSNLNGAPKIVALISGTRHGYYGGNNGIALAIRAPLDRVMLDAEATRGLSAEALPFWTKRNAAMRSRAPLATQKRIKIGGGLKSLNSSAFGSTGLGRKVVRPPGN